jgi:uncharacterized repeat protein (TIGR02543 family)
MKNKLLGTILLAGSLLFAGMSASTSTSINNIANGHKAKAVSSPTTYEADSLAALKSCIFTAKDGDNVLITKSITIPTTAETDSSSAYVVVSKSITLLGSSPDITIKREGELSIMEFAGSRSFTVSPVNITLRNLTFDGGAKLSGANPGVWTNSGVKGRSILDVTTYAIINLEEGVTVRNGWCSIPYGSHSDASAGLPPYGGGIRIDWGDNLQGGRVNLRSGSLIERCVAINDGTKNNPADGNGYGGGIGGYGNSEINIYGGTIQKCYAAYGGAASVSYRRNAGGGSDNELANQSGLIHMTGGLLDNNYAEVGGALLFDGGRTTHTVYGGSITNNHNLATTGHGYTNTRTRLGGGAMAGIYCDEVSISTDVTEGVPCTVIATGNDEIALGQTYCGLKQIYYVSGSSFGGCDTYKTTFETNGANTILPQSTKKNTALGDAFPTYVYKEGKVLTGWYPNADFTGTKVTADTVISASSTVYAKWDNPVYIVTYNSNGGSTVNNVSVSSGDKLVKPTDPTKKDYTFAGWYKDSTFTTAWNFDTDTVTSALTLYAKWVKIIIYHTVSFDTKGGSTIDPIQVEHYGRVVKPTDPTKTGYIFSGWYKDSGGTYPWAFEDYSVTENITLYAKWRRAYTVKFSTNGGTKYDPVVSPVGELITKPTDPVKIGYTFGGWYKEARCANAWDFDSDTVLDNITLYAKWTVNDSTIYDVSFESNGGSIVTGLKANGGTTIKKPTDPTKEGYTFAGWYKESALTNAWNFDTDVVTGAITLYAKWMGETPVTYNVAFNSNGGSSITGISAEANATITKPTNPTKDGYVFDGWYKEAELTNAWNFATDTVTSDITLYAKWVVSGTTYNVTFNSNGGSSVTGTSANAGSLISKPADPTKEGYTFAGWYKDEALTNVWSFDSDLVTESITLYAKWAEVGTTYNVTFNSNGGSSITGVSVNAGGVITKPTDPTKEGYSFAGWYKEASLTNAWDFAVDTVSENLTLYAKWTETGSGTIEVTSISLNVTSYSLYIGEETTLVASISPSNATDKSVTWISSKSEVATVSATGKVVAIAIGTATIAAVSGSKTATCVITVSAKKAPTTPSVNEVTEPGTNGFTASWASVTGAVSYQVDVSTKEDFSSFVPGYENKAVTDTSLVVDGLSSGETYYFRVRSVDSSGSVSVNSPIMRVALTSSPSPTGLSGGAIAGIVIACVVGFFLFLIAGLYILWKKKDYRYGIFAVILVPIFRFINKVLFRTRLNDVELKEQEEQEEAKKQQTLTTKKKE